MDHFIDIRLRPEPEFPAYQLMGALFGKFHLVLARLGIQDIGVSFPDVNMQQPSLGDRLRLHGNAFALSRLTDEQWLAGVRDHVVLGPVTPVPERVAYRHVVRVQAKSSPDRLRRRQMLRHGIELSEAERRYPDDTAKRLDLPFASLVSQSTGQPFHLFVSHGSLLDQPTFGAFNSYGLSQEATVPWF